MPDDPLNLNVILILTVGFTLASLFGYLTQKIKLSPILGYLVAGYVIGPFFPGFTADLHLAEQLAEVGVMLMMFGVGLHFKWEELYKVRRVAVPGALGQVFLTATVTALFVYYLWGTWESGVIIGLAIGVASTVVLVRVLSDNNLLHTLQGHIAVGWLIVEDVLTVAVLILLPTIVALLSGDAISTNEVLTAIALVIIKFTALIALMFTLGKRFVSFSLFKITKTRSPELFTLTVLALTGVIATGSALIFGASIAFGAFIAGIVIGQTNVRHQALAYASPMKDVFVVIFFLAVGMLFNPMAIVKDFPLFVGILLIILIVKPLAAFIIVFLMRYPLQVALSVAFSLAQIGEFSFILAEQANRYDIFPDEAFDIIVACALVSISINPLFFIFLKRWGAKLNGDIPMALNLPDQSKIAPKALLIGFGSIEQNIIPALEAKGFQPVVIDKDVDRVIRLIKEKREAVYGEASFPTMLRLVKIEPVKLVILKVIDLAEALIIIQYTRDVYPHVPIIARTESVEEASILIKMDVRVICEEEEITGALKRVLDLGEWRSNKLNRGEL